MTIYYITFCTGETRRVVVTRIVKAGENSWFMKMANLIFVAIESKALNSQHTAAF